MKTRKIIVMAPLVLLSATSFGQGSDDRAVPRGSGGGSSSSGDAGARHTGGTSSASSSGTQGSSAGSSSSPGYDYSPSSDAASRRPRPGTGTGDRGRFGSGSGVGSYNSYPNSYYYYNPFSYNYGYPGRYGYGYGYYDYGFSYGDYYGYYPTSYSRSYRYRSGYIGQVRTLVEPARTRIYVDGYYAGIADDFDGLLQRLNVSPGRHDIALKLEGYTSHTFAIYANREQTLKLRWDMVKGSGETRDSIGSEANDRLGNTEEDRVRDDPEDSREVDSEPSRRAEPNRRYVPPSRETERGEVTLEIEPLDASVYVDGEFFGKASQVLRLELPAGRHRIEVVRPGYKTEETEVEVERASKPVLVKVKLERR